MTPTQRRKLAANRASRVTLRKVSIRFCVMSRQSDTKALATKLLNAARSGLSFLGRRLRGYGFEIEIQDGGGEFHRYKFERKPLK
jgi:hypothetical protein